MARQDLLEKPRQNEQDHAVHNPGDSAWDQLVNHPDIKEMDDNPEMAALSDQLRDQDRAGLQQAERSKTPTGSPHPEIPDSIPYGSDKPSATPPGRLRTVINAAKKYKAITIGIGGGGIVSAVLLSIFTFSTAPIAFLTTTLDDLNDQVVALSDSHDNISRARLRTIDEKFVSGCQIKLSVMCKLRSMNETEVNRLKTKGIEVVERGRIGKRVFIKAYKFEGKEINGPQYLKEMSNRNSKFKLAFRDAMNMKYLSFYDKIFGWVRARFQFGKAKPPVTDNIDESYDKIATGDTSDKVAIDADGVPVPEDGESDPEVKKRVGALAEFANSKIGTNFFKSINIIGSLDTICTLKNMVGFTSVMGKVYKQRALIAYAAPIASLIHAVQAGDGTVNDGELLGKFFGEVDARQTIPDVEATARSVSSPGTDEVTDVQTTANPYYGKNGMASTLYQTSAGYGPAQPVTPGTLKYSLGFSMSAMLGALGAIVSVADQIPLTSDDACAVVQNWLVRSLGFITGIAAMFTGVGEVNWAANVALFVATSGAFFLIGQFLNSIVSGNPVSDDIKEDPEGRAAAFWTGMSGMMGAASLARGMMPASKAAFANYRKFGQHITDDYIALERSKVSPFDTSSPYSAAGSLSLALNSRLDNSSVDPLSRLASIAGLITSSPSQLLKSDESAYAASTARLDHCDDKTYTDIDINADIQCNVRYVMRPEDMKRDVVDVYEYMENNGYVEAGTETGLPQGYVVPDARVKEETVTGLIMGVVEEQLKQFIDLTYANIPGPGKEYAKFLDWCTYRTLPWGETYQEAGAIGSAEDDWITGEKCTSDDEMISYFRAYTMHNTTLEVTEPAPDNYGRLTSPFLPQEPAGTCPEGTTSVPGIIKGWTRSGTEQPLTLCSIPGTTMSVLQHWTDPRYQGTSAAGVTQLAVSSTAASSLLKATQLAKADGVSLSGSIGYRSLYEQCSILKKPGNLGSRTPGICPSWITPVPGNWTSTTLYSNHMLGRSIDFYDSSERWMRRCVRDDLDGTNDNRCYGFYDDVYQSQGWDSAHFTHLPVLAPGAGL